MLRFGRPVYEKNPFLDDLKGNLLTSRKLKRKDTVEEITFQTKNSLYQRHIQLMKPGIEEIIKLASEGSIATWVLFLILYDLYEIGRDVDYVKMTHTRACTISNTIGSKVPPQPTFSRGIVRLINSKFLADHVNGVGWYFINPSRVFNGNISEILNETSEETPDSSSSSIPVSCRNA